MSEEGSKPVPSPTHRSRHPAVEFMIAAAATSCACVLSNPMEVVKTRMQLQGELVLQSSRGGGGAYVRPYRNFFDAFYKICRDEGLRGIQSGLLPGLFYQVSMNGTRLSLFGKLQGLLGANSNSDNQTVFFLKNLAAGAICGGVGAVVGSPFFLVKARLQSQSEKHPVRTGGDFRYRGMVDAFTGILHGEGLRGLTRGMDAAVLRVAVGSAAQLSSYSSCKDIILQTGLFEDNIYAYLASSMFAGLVVTTAMNPFDVISTRLYAQGGGVKERYQGPLDCAIKTVRIEGFQGLYKGWTAHYFRLGPHTIFTFLFWEELKKAAYMIGI